MLIILQLVLYCLLFTAMVKYAVRGGAVDGLYFYPKAVQKRAFEIGMSSPALMAKKRIRFMLPFCVVLLAALLLTIGLWNRQVTFSTAYFQALLFLEVMNWYDGIVIDRLWVGYSKFWILPGTEDIPFLQTWPQVMKKRGLLTLVWIVGAAIVAGLVVLIF